jgi:hypothetical protein
VDEQTTAAGRWLVGDTVEGVLQAMPAMSAPTAAQLSEEILIRHLKK